LLGVILAFNVKVLPDAEEEARARGIQIFRHEIVYHLIEEYKAWVDRESRAAIERELSAITLPGKILVLANCVFRRSRPAIFGVRVLGGRIRPGYSLMRNDGKHIGEIMQIQDKSESLPEATTGKEVAISMKEAVVGRHFGEGDILYTAVSEKEAKVLLTTYRKELSQDDFEVLKEIIEIMRRARAEWGLGLAS
jgi:translation initiation factor 5B